jgi:hypothetical protein
MENDSLVTILKEKQGDEKDAAFAARLGINRETWRLLKRGTGRPSRKTLVAIMRAYPELQIAVASSLLPGNASIPTVSASEVTS